MENSKQMYFLVAVLFFLLGIASLSAIQSIFIDHYKRCANMAVLIGDLEMLKECKETADLYEEIK